MILNILWTIFTLSFSYVLLRWRSPLLLITPGLVLASITSPFSEGDVVLINLIMAGWSIALITVAIYMHSRQIALDCIAETSADFARLTTKHLWLLALAMATLLGAFGLWLDEAGITELASQKRSFNAGPFFHILNAVFGLYSLHAVIVLSMMRFRLNNPHTLLAAVTFIILFLVGYLASRRSIVIFPMAAVLLIRFARMQSITKRFRIFLIICATIPALVLFMALVSAKRAGYEDIDVGLDIVAKQMMQEDGYGFSPAKDRTVWQFSERTVVPEVRTVLLGGFYGLIPRFLWENKPAQTATGPIAGSLVFRGEPYVERGAGIPISFPAEVSLAFGGFWFFGGLLGAAALMILVAELAHRIPSLMIPSIFFYASLVAGGLPKSQISLIVGFISILILNYIFGIRVVNLKDTAQTSVQRQHASSQSLDDSSKRRHKKLRKIYFPNLKE